MKKKNVTIVDFFQTSLQRMLQAEEDILKQLKQLIAASHADRLKLIYENHADETEEQIQRLKNAIETVERSPKLLGEEEGVMEKGKKALKAVAGTFTHKSEAINGLVKENKEVFKEFSDTLLHDVVLASGTQAIEMDEITAYKNLVFLAKTCGYLEIADLLQLSLNEEQKAYEMLWNFTSEETKKIEKTA